MDTVTNRYNLRHLDSQLHTSTHTNKYIHLVPDSDTHADPHKKMRIHTYTHMHTQRRVRTQTCIYTQMCLYGHKGAQNQTNSHKHLDTKAVSTSSLSLKKIPMLFILVHSISNSCGGSINTGRSMIRAGLRKLVIK